MAEPKAYEGGCHCGAVRYEVSADLTQLIACNCSICQKHGLVLTFAPAEKFKLRSGNDHLTEYLFNTGKVHHMFCKACGVESFARGANPDGTQTVAINARCLDGVHAEDLSPTPYDGRSR